MTTTEAGSEAGDETSDPRPATAPDHEFAADTDGPGCARCGLPRVNRRHRPAHRDRNPGPDLARVDVDVTATGVCAECTSKLGSFEAASRHAAREHHTVQITERRVFDVVPRNQKDNQ